MELDTILKSGRFSDVKVKETLVAINPRQVVNTIGDITITIYEVKYQYTTVRNNRKNGTKYFIMNSCSPEQNMEKQLELYIQNYNKDNPSRLLSNVKFLEGKCLDLIRL